MRGPRAFAGRATASVCFPRRSATFGPVTISVSLIRALVDAVVRANGSETELLAAVDLDPSLLADPLARVTPETQDRLFEEALRITDDPALGLHMGETTPIGAFGVPAHMVLHSRNVREALEVLFRYHRIIADCEPSRLDVQGELATIIYTHVRTTPLSNQIRAEFGVRFLTRVGAMMMGAEAQAHAVHFEHAAPAHADEVRASFGVPVHFDQSFSGIVVARETLERPHRFANTEVFELLRTQADQLLRTPTQTGGRLVQRIHEVILERYADFEPTLPNIARALSMSERTLRRKLQAEGTQFRHVLRDAYAQLARRILREPDTTIQEAAYRLGFSEPSAFHHAFKRWTGGTPSEYRASLPRRG